ncbi:PucR family transcriptional regulator [Aneurinibacillus aneurinilyticus]|nr:PucR family transcriptional regulator [Aneurinibacillus aneurinilyticus]MED0709584.1 PucR family transcriptional regulator ligand-binding domain-containing protein [Aneurinibacillus aneurinilyticus]MED0723432.1 PucR family transcriptional regulator ligand-binding domain-containing protein [Aneurinibacillus aneurinilyticus]MED0733317.1 PucR family transcriptional regulator ligand-binding domain-containing protein [Aneurinibacillus aneurinilyticus]MED0743477.1 PucR family transcriptional regul
MSITLKEALELPNIQQIKLIGGHGGLHRIIKWVTIVEIIEDATRLQEGEFLITTGYGLDTIANRRDFIEQLVQQNLSAVAIHTGFYMERIPLEFIEAANEHNLPLIEIPRHMNFSEVTKALLGHIVNRQLQLMQDTQQIHHELTMLTLNNKGLAPLVDTLAARLQAEVEIYDVQGRRLEGSGKNAEASLSLEKLISLQQTIDMAAPLSLSEEQLVHPIATAQEQYGFLHIQKQTALTEMDRLIVEQAGIVCAIEFLKQKAVDEALIRMREDVLDELLENSEQDEAYLQKLAHKLNYRLEGIMTVMQIASVSEDSIRPLIQSWTRRQAKPVLLREKQRTITLVIPVQQDKDVIRVAQSLQQEAQLRLTSGPLYIGMSTPFCGLGQIAASAQEAREALQIGITTGEVLMTYDKIGAFAPLLQMKKAGVELSTLFRPLLDPLLTYDQKHNSSLVDTLECYLQHNSNIKNTAAALFIHRHTLKYRLEQIEEKTNKDLQNAHTLTQFHLALMAYRLDHAAFKVL